MGYQAKFSFVNLLKDVSVSPEKWSVIPSEQDILATITALENNNIRVMRAKDGSLALEKIKEIIPPGAEVMNGSSTTLIEIGYEEFIKRQQGWKDLRRAITSEKNDQLRADGRLKRRAASSIMHFLFSRL